MNQTTTISVDEVIEKVASYYNLTRSELLSPEKETLQAIWARQVLIYALWTFTDITTQQVATLVGFATESIRWTVRAVKDKCLVNRQKRKEVIAIESLFD